MTPATFELRKAEIADVAEKTGLDPQEVLTEIDNLGQDALTLIGAMEQASFSLPWILETLSKLNKLGLDALALFRTIAGQAGTSAPSTSFVPPADQAP